MVIREDSTDNQGNTKGRAAIWDLYDKHIWNKNPGMQFLDRGASPLRIMSSKVFLHATTVAEESVFVTSTLMISGGKFLLPDLTFNYSLEKAILKAVGLD